MFEHLRVFNIKGLKECTLLDLGKINVICGRNNSGKSTLLEGINDINHSAYGKKFGEETVAQVYEMTFNSMGWGDPNSHLNRPYLDLLKRVLGADRIWYSNEADVFTGEVERKYRESGKFGRWAFGGGAVNKAYKSLFPKTYRTVLLPPKRYLELARHIETAQAVSPDGRGILNYLFYAKNQPESSEDRGIYERISDAFTQISSGYGFDIFTGKDNQIGLSFSYKNQPWIKAGDCGLGLQDLIAILYFSLHPQYDVVLIEEPESHVHPDMQRRLLHSLKEETSKQFFLTTHSNVFLNSAFVDKVFFTYFDASVKVDDATSRASILHDIGYGVTDNLVSDLVILVEGPLDIPVLEEFLIKWGLFSSHDIKTWPLGGDIMNQLDLSVFAQSYSIIALVDNDPGSEKTRKKFMENCEQHNIPVHRLERYSIENYFSLRALREVFGPQIPSLITEIDPNKKLEDQIEMDVKKNNRRIARKMTLDEIEGTDLHIFFEKVEELCK
jgi:hypothetical protein